MNMMKYPGQPGYFIMFNTETIEVLAKPLGARTSCPQILDKYGQNARVPGKVGGFARTSITLSISYPPLALLSCAPV